MDRVLRTPAYRDRARALQTEIEAALGLDGLVEMIGAVAATRAIPLTHRA